MLLNKGPLPISLKILMAVVNRTNKLRIQVQINEIIYELSKE